ADGGIFSRAVNRLQRRRKVALHEVADFSFRTDDILDELDGSIVEGHADIGIDTFDVVAAEAFERVEQEHLATIASRKMRQHRGRISAPHAELSEVPLDVLGEDLLEVEDEAPQPGDIPGVVPSVESGELREKRVELAMRVTRRVGVRLVGEEDVGELCLA